MSKVKPKKQETFIDMTAMSDVTVLLLTFFMLTANFVPKEPVQVMTPASVSEVKIPEYDVMTILIDPKGQVYMNLDRPEDKRKVLESVGEQYGVKFTPKQITSFINQTHIGMPIGRMQAFLDLPLDEQDALMKQFGIPTDTIISANNQLAVWVRTAKEVNENLSIAIKADQSTPYTLVKNVMSTLQDLKENRYSLITTLKAMPEGF
ncbi:ExbD/TolR family protein [Dysgonomonas macrotermitis]|uniref:Outer membrane transport energization protein ExbD n=1 Tax=Dysgonomonas macrotermitis TaxID=1346286 RepID=A0A1M5GZ43_9BACT|nr:biopolymer transporter ExbD [Dysgonomonas macrotermitis]SHG09023.1 outer membrane transport energization protein ExbD [Dysgonomonas macrotermitis]